MATVGAPVIKLNGTIVKLNATIEAMDKRLETVDEQARESEALRNFEPEDGKTYLCTRDTENSGRLSSP